MTTRYLTRVQGYNGQAVRLHYWDTDTMLAFLALMFVLPLSHGKSFDGLYKAL